MYTFLLFCLPCLRAFGDFLAMHVKLRHIWLLSINPGVFLSVHYNSIHDQVDASENPESVVMGAQQVSLKY